MTWNLPRKVPVFDETELARRLHKKSYIMEIKTCSCGIIYSKEAWDALPLLGVTDLGDGARITMKNCKCGQTIGELGE